MIRFADAGCVTGEGPADGLLVHVNARQPGLRLELAGRRILRVVAKGRPPRAYLRIDDWWEELAWLAVDGSPATIAAPLDARTVRDAEGEPTSPRWWRYWMRVFALALDASAESPLFGGAWMVAPVPAGAARDAPHYPTNPADGLAGPPPLLHDAARLSLFAPLRRDDWQAGWGDAQMTMGALWPLRRLSAPEASRVKAWRKHARGGTLPPIVVWYVSVLGAFILIDGHDRLQAALSEGTDARFLAVWPARCASDEPIARAVASLAHASRHAPHARQVAIEQRLQSATTHPRIGGRTRVWPMRGGASQWRSEVDDELRRHRGLDEDDVAFLRVGR